MDRPALRPASPPIGVFAALARGFDRIAARPYLILPPLVLDSALWLGPHLGVEGLFRQAALAVSGMASSDPAWAERAAALRDTLLEAGSRFNLLSALSSFPVGIPSLMAGTMPPGSPFGRPAVAELAGGLGAGLTWMALTVVGLGLGAAFHTLIARPLPESTTPISGWRLWGGMLGLAGLVYMGLALFGTGTLAVATVVSLLVPLLGIGVLFVGFSLAFWGAIYLVFTPHGMVRHHLGLFPAMRESIDLVRWNLLGTTGLLAVLLAVDRLAGLVWLLPEPDSWFSGLAVVGHAFVSAMLVAASYAFYSGRREWWQAMRQLAVSPPVSSG
ncbi:MAG TPA: hypothetical protein VFI11_14310 [Anaerolineales bacterium]|nr:hypothetical protein [Anaerolineales bacterium]